jgi:hypothetical protein
MKCEQRILIHASSHDETPTLPIYIRFQVGVSQFTGISVYCNTEQNYIVSRYKSFIQVFSYTLCSYYFSSCLLVFNKIPVSPELLFFPTKTLEHINHFSDTTHIMECKFYNFEGNVQHTDRFLCLFLVFHGNILQYVL